MKARYIGGYGPKKGPITFVAEAAGLQEEYKGIPLVGRSGDYLDKGIKEVTGGQYCLDDCYRTNVIKYHPPENDLNRIKEIGHTIEEGVPQLWQELGDIKTNIIVPLGSLALNIVNGKGAKIIDKQGKIRFTGILKWRGSILKTLHLDKKSIPLIHPAALLRAESGGKGLDPKYKHIWKMDLLRAFEEATHPVWDVPNPHIEVIKDSVNLQRYLDRYKGEEYCVVDIETLKTIPICIGFAFNNWHSAVVPLMDIYSWKNQKGIPKSELVRMWQIMARFFARTDIKIVGQNLKFDHQAIEKICKMPIHGGTVDIMIMAHSLYPEFEKKLAFHQSLWTRYPYHKDEGKEFNIKKDDINNFFNYCGKDCVAEFTLLESFQEQSKEIGLKDFPNWEEEFLNGYALKLHDFYKRMESVGILNYEPKRQELIAKYREKLELIDIHLDSLTGGKINYASPKQLKVLLFDVLGLPTRPDTKEDTLVALEANNCKNQTQRKILSLLRDRRRIAKALGTYFKAKPDYDNRMRTSYRICGAETGRSSTSILQPPVRPEKLGHAFQTLTKHGEFGPEVREQYIADPGYTLVETDLSQAEARIVALLANDEKTLELFRLGEDIHSLTTKWIFQLDEDTKTIKWKYPELRFIGKTTRHAGNYDMHKNRLMNIVNSDAKKFGIDIAISEWRAGKILAEFHRFSPNIRGVFHPEVKQALKDNDRILVNPFGRYRNFFADWGPALFREAFAHIPQSTVPDHLRKAGMRVESRLHEMNLYNKMTQFESVFVLEGHDSLIGLIRDDYVDTYISMMHEELEKPIDFSRCTISRGEVIIPAETKFGKVYKECKDKNCQGCSYLHDYNVERLAA